MSKGYVYYTNGGIVHVVANVCKFVEKAAKSEIIEVDADYFGMLGGYPTMTWNGKENEPIIIYFHDKAIFVGSNMKSGEEIKFGQLPKAVQTVLEKLGW